jgi:hypothetical protein
MVADKGKEALKGMRCVLCFGDPGRRRDNLSVLSLDRDKFPPNS